MNACVELRYYFLLRFLQTKEKENTRWGDEEPASEEKEPKQREEVVGSVAVYGQFTCL